MTAVGTGGGSAGRVTIRDVAKAFGEPFTLVDQSGEPITEKAFRGQPSAVFFGFTHCPEICPTTLFEMDAWLKQLGDEGKDIRAYFVSIDPERDTPSQLAGYVSQFNPRMAGLTGTPEQIASVARAYRVYYAKAPSKENDGYYTMDHSSFVYFMSPDGRFLEAFAHGTTPDKMAQGIRAHIKS